MLNKRSVRRTPLDYHQEPTITMTEKTKVVTAAYCRNFDHTGFVSVRTKQFYSGQFPLLNKNDFFQPTAILHEHTVWVHRKYKKPAKFLVLYDRRKHEDGTINCNYMVMRIGKDNIVQEVDREHFLLVGQCITK